MPTVVQFRRGTTAENNAFTGSAGELSVDLTLDTVRVHDGSTAGGFALVSATATQTLTNKTLTTPAISGNITVTGNVMPAANATYNMGSTVTWWNIFYGKSVQAQYADLAENYQSDKPYGYGTVVVFGGEKEITVTSISHDTRVAGIVSDQPAYLMNAVRGNTPVALTGRVPCQVKGPVDKGTVLVSSSIPGVAIALNPKLYNPGCVLGKSLESIDSDEIKVIEVAVGRF